MDTGIIVYCWWKCKMVMPHWKNNLAVLHKAKHRVTINPAVPLPGAESYVYYQYSVQSDPGRGHIQIFNFSSPNDHHSWTEQNLWNRFCCPQRISLTNLKNKKDTIPKVKRKAAHRIKENICKLHYLISNYYPQYTELLKLNNKETPYKEIDKGLE